MTNNFPKNDILNSSSSIFFATFSRYENGRRMPTNGMVEPVLYFFMPKAKSFLMLDLPHLVSDTIDPFVEIYKKGKMKHQFRISKFLYFPVYLFCKISSKNETRISFKLRDFFSVLFIGLTQKERYDLFIGLEAICTLAGILLRQIGKTKKVVYYVSDYSPIRFENKLFNSIYIWLDRFCVTHADYTWDVSPAMQKGRFKAGLDPRKKYHVVHVPNGLFPAQIKSLSIEKRNRNDLIYMGILEPDMGADLAIRAFAKVHNKYPKLRLHIIGGPEKHIEEMKRLTKALKIENVLVFHGFIPSNEKMAEVVRSCYIGLAPYRSFHNSKRWYGDAGKIRQYTAAGLPVVTTHVPPLGRYIVKHGAGVQTQDTVKSFSEGIMQVLSNPKLYKRLSDAAVKVSQDNTWRNVYTKALHDMQKLNRPL